MQYELTNFLDINIKFIRLYLSKNNIWVNAKFKIIKLGHNKTIVPNNTVQKSFFA